MADAEYEVAPEVVRDPSGLGHDASGPCSIALWRNTDLPSSLASSIPCARRSYNTPRSRETSGSKRIRIMPRWCIQTTHKHDFIEGDIGSL